MTSSASRPSQSRRQVPTRLTAVLTAVGLALLIGAGVSVLSARSASADRSSASADLMAFELLDTRDRLTWVHLALLTDGLWAELGGPAIDEQRLDRFHGERDDLIDRLQLVADGDSRWAGPAAELVAKYDEVDFEDWPYRASDLDDQHYISATNDLSEELNRRFPRHERALLHSILPQLVLADGLAVGLTKANLAERPWLESYVSFTYDTVQDTPGWLGPDRADPLRDNAVTDPPPEGLSDAQRTTPRLALQQLQAVWQYDQWLIDNAPQDFSPRPPFAIDELVSVADGSSQALQETALGALQADADARTASMPGSSTIMVWWVAAAVSGLAAMGSFAVVVKRLLGGHRELTETSRTDPLTGARNRRFLDDEVAARCQREQTHHVVAMVDLDRFKMVNDTWGHDAGDALLIHLARELKASVVDITGRDGEGLAAVVRAGGDEFIVAIHSPNRMSLPEIEGRLRALTGPVDLGLEERVDLQFSLGLAEADKPAQLADLVKAADLGAYEDKRMRSQSRQANLPVSEPVGRTIEIP